MSFFNKLKWVLGISMVFILIVATNLIDRNNFIRVRDSVVSIYEDRLVAKNLILDMSNALHEKELAIATADYSFYKGRNSKVNNDIEKLIIKFEQTRLTTKESEVFAKLKENFETLKRREKSFVETDFKSPEMIRSVVDRMDENLYQLSHIQMEEGSRQMAISKKAIDTVELFTQMEIYLLIFLAIVAQIIVMYKPKEESTSEN